jgi:hypothetical protein
MKLAILSVDDERIILDSIKIQIEKNFNNQYLFEYAESAEEALEVIDDLVADARHERRRICNNIKIKFARREHHIANWSNYRRKINRVS